MNGDEFIKGQPIRVYDKEGARINRYTVVYMNRPYSRGSSAPHTGQTAYTRAFPRKHIIIEMNPTTHVLTLLL